MKRTSKLLVLVALFGLVGFSSCNDAKIDAKSTLNNVPEDASFLLSINPKQLMEKADFEAVKKMAFYKEMLSELEEGNEKDLIAIMNNPTESGIDLDRNANIFFAPNPEDMEDLTGGIIFGIADADKLEAILKKSKDKVQEGDGFKYINASNDGVIAWTETVGFAGTAGDEDNIEATLKGIFAGDSKITSNSSVKKALGSGHDISYWMTSSNMVDALYDEFQMQLSMASLKKEDLMNNNFSGYTDFEKGKIESIGKYDLTNGLLKDLKLLMKEEVKTNFRKHIPNKNLGMVFTGAVNMKGVNQLLKDKGASGLFNTQAKQYDMTSDDVADAIDGDMFVANYMVDGSMEPQLLVGMKIGDVKKFDKMLDIVVGFGMLSKAGKGKYRVDAPGNKMDMIIVDNIAFISNDALLLAKASAGDLSSSEQVDKKLMGQLSDGIFGMFMDFNNLANAMGDDVPFADQMESMTSTSTWKESSAVMLMKDKNQNSLKTIMKIINEGFKQQQDMRKKFESEENVDL